jgi:hypothetical protein
MLGFVPLPLPLLSLDAVISPGLSRKTKLSMDSTPRPSTPRSRLPSFHTRSPWDKHRVFPVPLSGAPSPPCLISFQFIPEQIAPLAVSHRCQPVLCHR